MTTVQRTFRLDESLDQQFCDIAEKLGTSPSDSLRMFVTVLSFQIEAFLLTCDCLNPR